MKLTKHLDSSEFNCRDGSKYPANWIYPRLKQLSSALEIVRAITGQPMMITSGYRSPAHNKSCGGKKYSQHLQGRAADFKLKGITPKKLFPILDRFQRMGVLPKGGLHAYPTFVHLDIRGRLARW